MVVIWIVKFSYENSFNNKIKLELFLWVNSVKSKESTKQLRIANKTKPVVVLTAGTVWELTKAN